MRASGQTLSNAAMSREMFPTLSPILLAGYQKKTALHGLLSPAYSDIV